VVEDDEDCEGGAEIVCRVGTGVWMWKRLRHGGGGLKAMGRCKCFEKREILIFSSQYKKCVVLVVSLISRQNILRWNVDVLEA
jgi:hypothetical protein